MTDILEALAAAQANGAIGYVHSNGGQFYVEWFGGKQLPNFAEQFLYTHPPKPVGAGEVLELIFADRCYDEARHAWDMTAPSGLGELDQRSNDAPEWNALQAAKERREIALAKFAYLQIGALTQLAKEPTCPTS